MKKITIFNNDQEFEPLAQELRRLIGFEVSSNKASSFLYWKAGSLWLHLDAPNINDISFDFIKELHYHQSKHYSLKKEPLAKAVGLYKNKKLQENVSILDATCGTGKDSMLLLSFGAHVVAYESSKVVFALLWDARRRACESEFRHLIEKRFRLKFGSAITAEDLHSFDSVFLDPMYPEKKKSALPRQEMVVFQELKKAGLLEEGDELAEFFINRVKRLAIKRPLSAPVMKSAVISFSGKSTRYDIYVS